MNRKSVISLILLLIMASTVSACGSKQKTSVLTSDVKQEAAMQESEVKKYIADGTDLLSKGKFDDAKSTFEKAISMDKANKGAYIEIKNKYVEKQRLDDAYYFIKLAISNNVDTENMKPMLNDIKSKFEVEKVNVKVCQNAKYALPAKIKARINNECKEVDVVWNTKSVDTSKVGSTKYEGRVEQYDRSAVLNLDVIKAPEVKKAKKIGGISKAYEKSGKRYLDFDEVEFFMDKDGNDETAEREAIKDGVELMPDGRIANSYYVRNKDKSLTTYEISPDAKITVCGFSIKMETIEQQPISFNKFKTLEMSNELGYGTFFYIYLENNVIVKMEEQFIP